MHEFETKLSTKSRSKIDYNSSTLDLLPSFGNELGRVEASDFALLANKETEMLFYSKLADSSLNVRMPRQKKREAVLITIDCSGSMEGERYAMACGFGLAMIKMLQNDNRGWSLQMFSSNVVGTMMFDSTHGFKPTIHEAINMLLTPHFGGTSFYSAIQGMFDVRDFLGWRESSYIVISDGQDNISREAQENCLHRKMDGETLIGIGVKETSMSGLGKVMDRAFQTRNVEFGSVLEEVGNSLL